MVCPLVPELQLLLQGEVRRVLHGGEAVVDGESARGCPGTLAISVCSVESHKPLNLRPIYKLGTSTCDFSRNRYPNQANDAISVVIEAHK